MRTSIVLGVALGLLGCATPARQTELFLRAPRDLPETFEIPNVPFVDQTENYCGPATLTMALRWAGLDTTIAQVAPQVLTPGANGSYPTDMMVAARRNGMLAVPVRGIPSLLHEVAAGHPVIVFENLALKWYPKWHYAVVLGYDLQEEEVVLHDGHRANRRWSMRKFERSWMLSDYWGFTVLPPGELSATADELAHATAGAGLEREGKIAEAEKVYRSVLAKWPASLGALIGMGNLAYARGEYRDSAAFLRRATASHPESAAAWHNLAIAEGRAGRAPLARRSALRALELAKPETSAAFRESLKEWASVAPAKVRAKEFAGGTASSRAH